MLPFMYHELSKVLTQLRGLIFKKKKLNEAKTLTKIMKEGWLINPGGWLNNPGNKMEEFLIDAGAATQYVLSSLKVSVEKKRKVSKGFITFILNILLKLQECLPTQYAIVRIVSAISPVSMAEEDRFMSKRFLRLANDLHSLKFIASSMADNAIFQYDEFFKK